MRRGRAVAPAEGRLLREVLLLLWEAQQELTISAVAEGLAGGESAARATVGRLTGYRLVHAIDRSPARLHRVTDRGRRVAEFCAIHPWLRVVEAMLLVEIEEAGVAALGRLRNGDGFGLQNRLRRLEAAGLVEPCWRIGPRLWAESKGENDERRTHE